MVKLKKEKKFYITTAIPYVNARPHIGHALEFVQTDVIARFHRLLGEDVFFLTGTDENAQKNVLVAEKKGIDVKQLVDENTLAFQQTLKLLNISNDGFIRTTDKKRHWPGAKKVWEKCYEAGDIYKKSYIGLYCVGCEAFLTEKDLKDGLCPEHLKPPERISEENYFFRLSKYKDKLEALIRSGELKIIPETRKNEVLSFISSGLEDFSISRPVDRMKGWGIPVPNDKTQIMYVWFDALTNYLTGIGYGSKDERLFKKYWPADMHVIGKGIIRFHAVYWPAMLLSSGLPIPKCIFVHGYVTVDGQKMSKSLDNIVNPNDMVKKYGSDAVRYFILKEISPFEDGDFSERSLVERVNNELVANIGNFIHRTLTFVDRYFDGIVPKPGKFEKRDEDLIRKLKSSQKKIKNLLMEVHLKDGLSEILSLSKEGNKYFQDNKPWELIKTDRERCGTVMYVCINLCRSLAILLHPYLPNASDQLLNLLNFKLDLKGAWKTLHELRINPGHRIKKPRILFKKLDLSMSERSTGEREMISFKDFKKVEMRIGTVKKAEEVQGSRKLIKMRVDFGDEERQVVAGLKEHYKPEELEGNQYVFVTNLEHARFMGEESEAMILAAVEGKEEKVVLIKPEKRVSNGTGVE